MSTSGRWYGCTTKQFGSSKILRMAVDVGQSWSLPRARNFLIRLRRKAPMVNWPQIQASPDVESEQCASHEMVRLIHKLRWIGMEDEAQTLQRSLRAMRCCATVLAIPPDTD
jgi:hypothetical protein